MKKHGRHQEYIEARVHVVAFYIIATGCTIRECGKALKIKKSTVSKDIFRLEFINAGLFEQVREVIEINKQERHIRGGEATKLLYQRMREQKENS